MLKKNTSQHVPHPGVVKHTSLALWTTTKHHDIQGSKYHSQIRTQILRSVKRTCTSAGRRVARYTYRMTSKHLNAFQYSEPCGDFIQYLMLRSERRVITVLLSTPGYHLFACFLLDLASKHWWKTWLFGCLAVMEYVNALLSWEVNGPWSSVVHLLKVLLEGHLRLRVCAGQERRAMRSR